MNYSNSFIPSYFNIRMRWEFKLATWQMQKEENEQSPLFLTISTYRSLNRTSQCLQSPASTSSHLPCNKGPHALHQANLHHTIILTSVLSKCWRSCPHWFEPTCPNNLSGFIYSINMTLLCVTAHPTHNPSQFTAKQQIWPWAQFGWRLTEWSLHRQQLCALVPHQLQLRV